ncbi:MAG TPA: adenine phosphoribosyltransferase [Acidimicrobiales bacterium]|nr:adenine phosphoribosyltransferase [Acidimicrobiales bacterium]
MASDAEWLKEHIRDIPDFPKPGVTFKDITPLLADPKAFRGAVDALCDAFAGLRVDKVLGIEARGFIIAAPVAYRLGSGFVPVRKAGKLPWQVEKQEYALEYGTDLLEIHRDAVSAGESALIIDDVMATGGTAAAAVRLVESLGATVAGLGFVLELGFLNGRERLGGREPVALVRYEAPRETRGGGSRAVPAPSGRR